MHTNHTHTHYTHMHTPQAVFFPFLSFIFLIFYLGIKVGNNLQTCWWEISLMNNYCVWGLKNEIPYIERLVNVLQTREVIFFTINFLHERQVKTQTPLYVEAHPATIQEKKAYPGNCLSWKKVSLATCSLRCSLGCPLTSHHVRWEDEIQLC